MHPLAIAMLQMMQQQAPQAPRAPGRPGTAALARAMAGRGKVDPKWASLPALKPYAESQNADHLGGGSGISQQGAFQDSAFENDAFQVSGVT